MSEGNKLTDSKVRKIGIIITSLTFAIGLIYSLYKWIVVGKIDGNLLFFLSIAFSYLLNMLTWGDLHGKKEKDELDEHIVRASAKISYFALMIIIALILFISEGTVRLEVLNNIPLVLALCASIVVLPLVELIVSRKYR